MQSNTEADSAHPACRAAAPIHAHLQPSAPALVSHRPGLTACRHRERPGRLRLLLCSADQPRRPRHNPATATHLAARHGLGNATPSAGCNARNAGHSLAAFRPDSSPPSGAQCSAPRPGAPRPERLATTLRGPGASKNSSLTAVTPNPSSPRSNGRDNHPDLRRAARFVRRLPRTTNDDAAGSRPTAL